MQHSMYEKHNHTDPDMPFLFFDGYSNQRGTNIYLHWHGDVEIIKFNSDSGIVYCNGRRTETRKGDVIIIPPNSLHAVCTSGEQVNFYCLLVDKTFYESKKLPLASLSLQLLVQKDEKIDYFIREIVSEFFDKGAYYKQQMQAIVTSLLIHICRKYHNNEDTVFEQATKRKKLIVKSIIEYLEQNYTDDISMKKLAQEMGFSYYYLCHIFKEITMLTIIEYIQQLRCNRAMQLLASTEQSVGEIAEQVGFNNVSYFTKIYKRCMGRLPSEDARLSKR